MRNADGGLTVLLGAGASSEAQLPMSFGLTKRIADEVGCRQGKYHGTTQALGVAVGAMIAYDTSRGGSPFAGIDVERLFSAVQMLAQRDQVELTPFVASWNAALDAVGRSPGLPAFFKKNLEEAVLGSGNLERIFTEGVQAVIGRDSGPVFAKLETQMIAALRNVLKVDPAAVDYLSPLLSASETTVQIATLNYDRSIEVLADRAGRTCDTGVQNWTGAFEWIWGEPAAIRLLKLHGSVDWWYLKNPPATGKMVDEGIEVRASDDVRRGGNSRLAVIFGQRGKLRSDGPFLAMLQGLDDFLATSRRLVVVGYSFRDEHINASIRRWFNRTNDPRMTIIDPCLVNLERLNPRDNSFLHELIGAISETGVLPQRKVLAQHQVIPEPASVGLHQCFGDGPALCSVGLEASCKPSTQPS